MNIDLGFFKADIGHVHKQFHEINSLKNIDVILKEGTSLTHPTFILNNMSIDDLAGVNAVYWGKVGRYYITGEPELMTGHRVSLPCNVDALKSFSADIDELTAYVTRQQTHKAPYFIDENLPIKCRKSIRTKTIGQLPRNTTAGAKCVLLTTSGA